MNPRPLRVLAGFAGLTLLYGAGYGCARATHVFVHRIDYQVDCTTFTVHVAGHRVTSGDDATPIGALALAFVPATWLESMLWSMVPRTYPTPTAACNE